MDFSLIIILPNVLFCPQTFNECELNNTTFASAVTLKFTFDLWGVQQAEHDQLTD